jgi:hypothetical protein
MRYDAVNAMLLNAFLLVSDRGNPCNSAAKNSGFENFCNAGKNFPKEKVKRIPMKTKIARHISPAAIAIALFLAVALLTRGGTITVINTNDSRVDYYVRHSPTPATAGTHRE